MPFLQSGDSDESHDSNERSSKLYDFAISFFAEYKSELSLSTLDKAISLFRIAVNQNPVIHSGLLNDLATALVARFWYEGLDEDLKEAISLFVEASALGENNGDDSALGTSHEPQISGGSVSTRAEMVESNYANVEETIRLANNILNEFHASGDISSLRIVVALHKASLHLRAQGHIERPASLSGLALALQSRFFRTGGLEDLDDSISSYSEALVTQPHLLHSVVGNNLCAALLVRFRKTGQSPDLHHAVSLLDAASGPSLDKDACGEGVSHLSQFFKLASPMPLKGVTITEYELQAPINYAIRLSKKFERTGTLSDLETGIFLHQEMLIHISVQHPQRSAVLSNLGRFFKLRHEHSGQPGDIDSATSCYREALSLRPPPHPDRSRALNNLATVLETRFSREGQTEDLEEMILLHREALSLRPEPGPDRSQTLINLAVGLLARFNSAGQIKDLEEALPLARESLSLRPVPHPDRSQSLHSLAVVLDRRFNQTGQTEDMEEAISLYREALSLRPVPHPDRWMSLSNLALVLHKRFDQRGQVEDLNESILLNREGLSLLPAQSLDRFASLNNLAVDLNSRFAITGQIEDVHEAISLAREANSLISKTHPNRWMSLNNLAMGLDRQFSQTGQSEDIEEAISLRREAISLQPRSHSDRWVPLQNLAILVHEQFNRSGKIADVDEAISLYREARSVIPAQHPDRSRPLNNLAITLGTRFIHTGHVDDVDEAISLHREALSLRPVPHPERSTSLNNLATALYLRFNQAAQMEDVDEAISLLQEAVSLRPIPNPDRSQSLNNLADLLNLRFGQTGQIKDVDEAISIHQEALSLRPFPHPDRSSSLSNLAFALHSRLWRTGQVVDADLGEAISLHREALSLRPVPHPDRPSSLSGLSMVLITRFQQTKRPADMDEAIVSLRECLNLLPPEHPRNCDVSFDLGKILWDIYRTTQQSSYQDDAIAAFRASVACKSASVSQRFEAASLWAQVADGSHASALEAYQCAIELLPRLAALGLDLQSRQRVLESGSDGLARKAAACAMRSGNSDMALELLEEGRAILWSQALQLRTPLDDLRLESPDLAQRLQDLSQALEKGAYRDTSTDWSDSTLRTSAEQEVTKFRHLNDEWITTLEDVRRLKGFEDFLRPKRADKLRMAANRGQVVILNASGSECAALIVTSSTVLHVPLLEFSLTDAKNLVKLIQTLTVPRQGSFSFSPSFEATAKALMKRMQSASDTVETTTRDFRKSSSAPGFASTPEDVFRFVLARLWVSVVRPVIRALNLKRSDSPPRLWWCPTGVFAFLPVHAAGIYHTRQSDCTSDYVVSSYTPTVTALLTPPPSNPEHFKVLIVIQPKAIGQSRALDSTRDELMKVKQIVRSDSLIPLDLSQESVSTETILSHLSTASIAHFACHGQQDTKNPLESALILDDGQKLKVSRIVEQPMPGASIAFLSACETALGDEKLPDEAIHIAASMLFAGFRGAVATMWSMYDLDGPKVTDEFYRYLFQSDEAGANRDVRAGGPDMTQAALALHLAVKKLREESCPFIRWVPFIHLGL